MTAQPLIRKSQLRKSKDQGEPVTWLSYPAATEAQAHLLRCVNIYNNRRAAIRTIQAMRDRWNS